MACYTNRDEVNLIFENVFRTLNKDRVRYVVAGGVAIVLHGHIRFTFDLDLMVDLSSDNLKKFIKTMLALGYKPRAPVRAEDFAVADIRKSWIRDKHMKVFTFHKPSKPEEPPVDVFVQEPIPFKELYRDREIVRAGNLQVPIVSVEHLLKLKIKAGREKDQGDIVTLKKLRKLSGRP